MIALYGENHLDSPFVFTAFVALKEKKVPFEFRLLDLDAKEQKQAPYGEQSITGRVPGLELDWFYLTESLAIVEYLDEKLPAPKYPRLLPSDLEQRARARQVLGWVRTDLAALKKERPTSSFFLNQPAHAPLSAAAEADAQRLLSIAARLLGEKQTLLDTWSIADADLALTLWRLSKNGYPMPDRLGSYAEAQWQRPSIAAWNALERPPQEKILGPF